MNEVVLEYRLTWPEYRRMQWRAGQSRNNLLVIVVVIFSTIVALAGDDLEGRIAAGIFVFGLLFMNFWGTPRIQWSNGLGMQELRQLTIDDRGIFSKSESLEFKIDWSQVAHVAETSDYFVLFAKRRAVLFVILKRGLSTQDEEAKLRHVLNDRVPTVS